jgi:hypothetical protein
MRVTPLALVVLIAFAAPLLAQTPDASAPPVLQAAPPAESAPPAAGKVSDASPSARFSFRTVDGGLLRLDSETGQVAFCSARGPGWACETVPEDRAAFDKEIGRLQTQIETLKQQLAAHEPAPPRPPAPVPDTTNNKQLRDDVARARAYLEDTWRRLVEMLMNFQKDVMQKT